MNRRVWWVMAVLCALVVLMPRAMAQRPPETHPTSEHRDIVMSWDRSAMPGDIELWAADTLLAYQSIGGLPYAKSHLVCSSASESSNGKCPVLGSEASLHGAGEIWIQAIETRSGLREEIRAVGSRRRPMTGQACSSDYWAPVIRPLWAADIDVCGRDQSAGIGASLRVPVSELNRLVAGKWRAQLVLGMYSEIAGALLAEYTFAFEFSITDHNAVSIYFPLFDQVTPHVGLNLQYDPLAQTIGGRTQLDMCLYDGLGSQSQYLGVTVRDSGPRPPGPSGYSVWHTDGGSDATQRVDYTVTLDHNGSALPLRNGVEQLLHGIDTAKLRLVLLPGMTQPVFCVPTPLTLDTPRVPVSSKRPGYYDGDLKVELRVPTVTP